MEDFHNPELQQHARGRAIGRRVRIHGGGVRGRHIVFLSRFSAFLRSEMKIVQPPHHVVTCACHKSSFSFFLTSCDCFGTFMQSIMYICLRFPTFSVANIMLLKMPYIVLCAVVLPLKSH